MGNRRLKGRKGMKGGLPAYDAFPGNAVKSGLKAKKVTTPIPYRDQGCDVVEVRRIDFSCGKSSSRL